MNYDDLEFIEERIGYEFSNRDLLRQAFVRRSYSKENGGANNEVLEFIGDKVLDLVVVKLLAKEYGYMMSSLDVYDEEIHYDAFLSEYQENKLTEIKTNLTQKKTLAKCIDNLGIAGYLIMSKGDELNEVQKEASVKEDLFEAILGAVALDSKWNMEEIEDTVHYMLQPEALLHETDDNYVALIQEWSLKRGNELPDIRTTESSYREEYLTPRNADEIRSTTFHNTESRYYFGDGQSETFFVSRMWLAGIDKTFVGFGHSKSDARKDVCELAYGYLEDNDLLMTIQDEIDEPSFEMAVNQLETLARRGYFSLPTYEFIEDEEQGGRPLWICECHIAEKDRYYEGIDYTKKYAKKRAAFDMLIDVLGIGDDDEDEEE